jgi:AraC-like DNA-binding protein
VITDTHIGFFDAFIFLGVFQGLLLSWFFIKNGKKERKANLDMGLLLLFLSLGIFEELLNNTGYIVRVLPLSDFSEPLELAYAPLVYLYIRHSLNPDDPIKIWPHFIIPVFWLFYMWFYWIQPNELKYNSYIHTKHPDWQYLDVVLKISDDPLGIRRYVNEFLGIQFTAYIIAVVVLLWRKSRSLNQRLLKTDHELLIILRNTTVHFIIIIAVFFATKLYFGMRSDIGGYWIASYISFMIYATSYQVLNGSDFFDQPGSFLAFPMPKYQKSSLSDERKEMILSKIKQEMEGNMYFTQNLASLSGLSRRINETVHHVSQVINEKMDKNFFELLAGYRVEHARKLIREDKDKKLTVEELADEVGYNSKSSFNTAFKKLTSQTPSEYRNSVNGR